jgi:hypothetical protein
MNDDDRFMKINKLNENIYEIQLGYSHGEDDTIYFEYIYHLMLDGGDIKLITITQPDTYIKIISTNKYADGWDSYICDLLKSNFDSVIDIIKSQYQNKDDIIDVIFKVFDEIPFYHIDDLHGVEWLNKILDDKKMINISDIYKKLI